MSRKRRWSRLGKDGAILALVGGRDYEASQFNRAVQAKRQAGSAVQAVRLSDGAAAWLHAAIGCGRPANADRRVGAAKLQWRLSRQHDAKERFCSFGQYHRCTIGR